MEKNKKINKTKNRRAKKCKQNLINFRIKNLFNPKYIYKTIELNCKRRNIPILINMKNFINWYNNTEKKCHYCELPEKYCEIISKSINRNVKRLTIDRIDNNNSYLIDNIVLACDLCNQIKGNILSVYEMKVIGQKIVKQKWEKIIKLK